MFAWPLLRLSTQERYGGHLWLGEAVATAGLVLLVVGLERGGRAGSVPAAAAAYIAAAGWFASSTAFANPATTVGRALTDTAAGIFGGPGPAQPSLNFCAAEPLQSQICSRVPFAVAPLGESRHRPDCGFSSEPSACCTHF